MTEEEIAYKMPPVDIGFPVKVYPYGSDQDKPFFAFVARAAERSLDVTTPNGQSRGAVRHISDPLLKSREESFRRECGAWDYTDERKDAMSLKVEYAALAKRVKSLEELLDKKTK